VDEEAASEKENSLCILRFFLKKKKLATYGTSDTSEQHNTWAERVSSWNKLLDP
jgi:hypothetical protein